MRARTFSAELCSKGNDYGMTNGMTASGLTKSELEDLVSQALDVLNDIYAPESTREDLVEGVASAIDILQGDGDAADDLDDADDLDR